MTWLRLDDGFASNKKIAALTDGELRVWMRLLCWCAKEQDPTVDSIAVGEVKGLTYARVDRYAELRLLDVVGDTFEIHDWEKYQPRDATNAERQARWRSRNNAARNGESNGEVRDEIVTSRTGTSASPSRPVPKSKTNTLAPKPLAQESKPRQPDQIWDTLKAVFGEPLTKNERGKRNAAAAQLREAGATPDEIHAAVRLWPKKYPQATCTAHALVNHWGALKQQARTPQQRLSDAARLREQGEAA